MSNIDKKKYDTQLKILFNSFFDSPKTRLMAALETGILSGNVCRLTAKLFEMEKIRVIKKAPCKITKHEAEYLSTNPKFWKNPAADKNAE